MAKIATIDWLSTWR